jgi:UDP-glucose 4-epimerase
VFITEFMSKILVSGGAGFIGSHLLDKLLLSHKNNNVIVIDNLSNRNNNFHIPQDGSDNTDFAFYNVDIRNRKAILEVFRHEKIIDVCIHLAAKISVADSISNPYENLEVNVNGTLNLLEACSAHKVKNFVFASSAAAYGEPKQLPIREDHLLDPTSVYGASKVAGESLVSVYTKLKKIERGVCLRFFNVYGKDQSPEYAGVITRFIERLSKGLAPVIYGDGKQTRDFISVNDVVSAILLAIKLGDKISRYDVFNIATGKAVCINELAQLMIRLSGYDLEPIYEEERKGDIKYNEVDITKSKNILGFAASSNLESDLEAVFKHHDNCANY